MACFERASPALKELLLSIHRNEKTQEIDHHIHEFASVHYHVQCSASDPPYTYLSISAPPLLLQSQGLISELPKHTLDMVLQICPQVMELVEPANQGFQLTLKLNLSRIPHSNKVSTKIITEISSVRAVILSSQLKEILINNVDDSLETFDDVMHKPIKLAYQPKEPFFVIRQTAQTSVVFPMSFKEHEDVVIATDFFQELMEASSSQACAKAPQCIWSPIPPPELRGEPIEDLSTNCGFVSFDVMSRHVEVGKRLDRTVWNLLNFYAFVKFHIKMTKSFVQRRMRTRIGKLIMPLQHVNVEEEAEQKLKKKFKGYKRVRKWISKSKLKIVKRKNEFTKKIKRIRSKIKIQFFSRLKRRWLRFPIFSSTTAYTRLK